jgi:hypothetical protein
MAGKRNSGQRKRRARKASDGPAAGAEQRASGEPGEGRGRRDEVGSSGVYSATSEHIPGDAEVRMAGSWGGGDYDESGGSELVFRDGQVLGGLTSGPDGKPTEDIHDNVVRPRLPSNTGDEPRDR